MMLMVAMWKGLGDVPGSSLKSYLVRSRLNMSFISCTAKKRPGLEEESQTVSHVGSACVWAFLFSELLTMDACRVRRCGSGRWC